MVTAHTGLLTEKGSDKYRSGDSPETKNAKGKAFPWPPPGGFRRTLSVWDSLLAAEADPLRSITRGWRQKQVRRRHAGFRRRVPSSAAFFSPSPCLLVIRSREPESKRSPQKAKKLLKPKNFFTFSVPPLAFRTPSTTSPLAKKAMEENATERPGPARRLRRT
jgi:hypothetical protein